MAAVCSSVIGQIVDRRCFSRSIRPISSMFGTWWRPILPLLSPINSRKSKCCYFKGMGLNLNQFKSCDDLCKSNCNFCGKSVNTKFFKLLFRTSRFCVDVSTDQSTSLVSRQTLHLYVINQILKLGVIIEIIFPISQSTLDGDVWLLRFWSSSFIVTLHWFCFVKRSGTDDIISDVI